MLLRIKKVTSKRRLFYNFFNVFNSIIFEKALRIIRSSSSMDSILLFIPNFENIEVLAFRKICLQHTFVKQTTFFSMWKVLIWPRISPYSWIHYFFISSALYMNWNSVISQSVFHLIISRFHYRFLHPNKENMQWQLNLMCGKLL